MERWRERGFPFRVQVGEVSSYSKVEMERRGEEEEVLGLGEWSACVGLSGKVSV